MCASVAIALARHCGGASSCRACAAFVARRPVWWTAMAAERAKSRPRSERMRSRSVAFPTNRPQREEQVDAEGDAGFNWGKEGRVGVYTANFGDVMGNDTGRLGLTALAGVSAAILCGQETSNEFLALAAQNDRICSDARFACSRSLGGDGLVVAGRQSLCSGIRTHADFSGSRGSERERSSQLFVTVLFRTGLAGRGSVGVGNVHLHRDLAKRARTSGSANWRAWCVQLADAIRQTECRVIAGDLNMALFKFSESMAEFGGLLVQLVAHHREVTPTTALAGLDGRSLLASMRFDSCGIWLVGGVFQVHSLSVDTQCVMAAMHPALLQAHGREQFKQYTRGYPLKSYMKPSDDDCSYHRACETPSDHALDQVLACWRAHSMEMVKPNLWQWEMNPHFDDAGPWFHCANCLPKTGEQMEAQPIFGVFRGGVNSSAEVSASASSKGHGT